MESKSTCVIVLGMSRSGTSALAGVVNHLGVSFGRFLIGPRPGVNDLGFFEDRVIVRMNDNLRRLLNHLKDPLVIVPVDRLDNIHRTNVLLNQKFEELLSDRSNESLWGFKHPGTEDLLPFWIKRLTSRNIEPVIIITVRHPMECFLSHSRWSLRHQVNSILAHWLKSNLLIEIYSRNLKRMIMTYDDLIANENDAVNRIAQHIGISDISVSRQQTLEFIRPDLKRNTLQGDHQVPKETFLDLYDVCLELYRELNKPTINQDLINRLYEWYIDNVIKDNGRFPKRDRIKTRRLDQI